VDRNVQDRFGNDGLRDKYTLRQSKLFQTLAFLKYYLNLLSIIAGEGAQNGESALVG
jgi:hypothetical protein